jgi:hypothetical protein
VKSTEINSMKKGFWVFKIVHARRAVFWTCSTIREKGRMTPKMGLEPNGQIFELQSINGLPYS